MERVLTFTINSKQMKQLEEWKRSLQYPRPLSTDPNFPKISFEFNSWSGIGPEVKAIENVTGATIDLTDVDSW